MRINGHLEVLGQHKNLRFEQLAADPMAPSESLAWYNTTSKSLKFFDGETVQILATGDGALTQFLKLDGSSPMTGELVLSSDDQSESDATVAVSKGHVDTLLADKQDTVTGAASTIVEENLTASVVVVTDANGKVSESTVTAAELAFIGGTTSNIQEQLDNKQEGLGYVPVDLAGDTMEGNLNLGNHRLTSVGAPVESMDAVRKIDLETALSGLDFQADVLGRFSAIDEEAIVAGRYLFDIVPENYEGLGAVNDIIVVDELGEVTAVAYDVSEAGPGALVWNRTTSTFERYDGTDWSEFGGLAGITAGIGLGKVGNTISVNLGAGVYESPTDEVGIDVLAAGGLFTTVDGVEASTDTDAQLAIKLADNALALSSTGLTLNAQGVEASHIAETVAGNGLTGGNGLALSVVAETDGGLTVGEDGVAVDDTEMRTRVLYLDGAESMTGPLLLDSDDQSEASSYTAVSKGYVEGELAIHTQALNDLETRLEQGFVVYSGVEEAAVTHTVTHNMGSRYVQVTVVDETDELVMPDSVVFVNDNTLTVTFYSAQRCRVIVSGLKVAAVAP